MNGLIDSINRSIEEWRRLLREIEDATLEAYYSGDESMPMNRSLYPDNWEQIALEIKENAGWTCQECGKPCRVPGTSLKAFIYASFPISNWDGVQRSFWGWTLFVEEAPQRFTLTVAHLDHNPANCEPDNLRALCSVCHLRYDAEHHAANAAETRRRQAEEAGQLPMLGEGDSA